MGTRSTLSALPMGSFLIKIDNKLASMVEVDLARRVIEVSESTAKALQDLYPVNPLECGVPIEYATPTIITSEYYNGSLKEQAEPILWERLRGHYSSGFQKEDGIYRESKNFDREGYKAEWTILDFFF